MTILRRLLFDKSYYPFVITTRYFHALSISLILVIIIFFTACSGPQLIPDGLTPIPTLIPATMPSSERKPTDIAPLIVESFPAGIPSAQEGQELYGENCAECHGVDGFGLVPNARNFGDVDYMRGETPVEFYTIITEGRGESMPAFGEKLSSDQRWDLVFFVWRFSTSSEILLRGHQLYSENCSACHGDDGRSMILGAANFPDQRFLSNQSPSDLYVSVTQGRGSMPAWQARLSQDDRWAVIDFIRTFTYDPILSEGPAMIETEEIPVVEEERKECTSYLNQENPFDWNDAEAINSGRTFYESCSGCHGEGGKGLLPGIVDFTEPTTIADMQTNAGEKVCTIAEGYKTMPGWKDSLTLEQTWQVLTFIVSLGNQ